MSWLARLRSSRLLDRRAGMALLWAALLAVMAATVNIAGTQIVGSIVGWERWLHAHASHFLAWRLLLYVGTAYGWWWMRRRLRQREPSTKAHQRLLRIEVAAVATVVLLEGSQLLRHG